MPERDLGRHYLRDRRAIQRMIRASGLGPGMTALDLGAGEGALTEPLAEAVAPGGRVVAVEIDPRVAETLRGRGLPGVEVVHANALEARLPRADAVVSNPPFRILVPLLRRLLAADVGRMVLVVPRELAERLTAAPGTERYGRLTVEVRLRAGVGHLLALPPAAFKPRPEVPASVVVLDPHPPLPGVDAEVVEAVLAHAWEAPERTLRHALAPLAAALRVSSGGITAVLRDRGWQDRRAADLQPDDYVALAEEIRKLR